MPVCDRNFLADYEVAFHGKRHIPRDASQAHVPEKFKRPIDVYRALKGSLRVRDQVEQELIELPASVGGILFGSQSDNPVEAGVCGILSGPGPKCRGIESELGERFLSDPLQIDVAQIIGLAEIRRTGHIRDGVTHRDARPRSAASIWYEPRRRFGLNEFPEHR